MTHGFAQIAPDHFKTGFDLQTSCRSGFNVFFVERTIELLSHIVTCGTLFASFLRIKLQWGTICEAPLAYCSHGSNMRRQGTYGTYRNGSWSSSGMHIAPLENNGMHIHLQTVHIPGHFLPTFILFLSIILGYFIPNLGQFVP